MMVQLDKQRASCIKHVHILLTVLHCSFLFRYSYQKTFSCAWMGVGRGGGGSGLIENNANSVCKIELILEIN